MPKWITAANLRRLERRLGGETDASARLRLIDRIHAGRSSLGLDRHYGLTWLEPAKRAE